MPVSQLTDVNELPWQLPLGWAKVGRSRPGARMRRRTLIWISLAVLVVVGGIAGYVGFLASPPDPAETAERIDLCEKIVLAALDSPPGYRRLSALEMRQLVIPRAVAISFRTDDVAASSTTLDVAVCMFANPFNSMYGRPGMIHATVKGRPVAQSLIDAVAGKWAASRP